MLMNIECSIVSSIKVALTFDNNKTKEREIAVGDLCYFEFNKNGKRKTIEGKVIKIGVSNTVDSSGWYIVVDGSLDFAGETERFCPNQILDVDIVQKHDTVQYISTPNDSTAISQIRYYNGQIQVSVDGGYSWLVPVNTKGKLEEDDEAYGYDDGTVKSSRKRRKVVLVTDESDTESDDEYYEDEDVIEDESY